MIIELSSFSRKYVFINVPWFSEIIRLNAFWFPTITLIMIVSQAFGMQLLRTRDNPEYKVMAQGLYVVILDNRSLLLED